MRKTLLGFGMLAAVALAAPHEASAGVSVAIGVPGVVVAPVHGSPVYYERPYWFRPHYYRPRVTYGWRHDYGRDCHRGRGNYYWKDRYDYRRYRGRDWDD